MRNYFSLASFLTVVLTVFLFVLGLFIFSLFGNVNINLGNTGERTFTVTGEGEVEVTPDTYTTTFTVRETASTQEEAQNAGNTKQDEAQATLTQIGIAQEDTQTTEYSINPVYDFTTSREVTGYEFVQSTTIETKDKNKIEQSLDRLAAIGINISGIQIEADEEESMQEARKKAVEDAKQKAEDLARAGGFRVGKIVTISSNGTTQPPIGFQEAAMPRGTNDSSTISPGTNQIKSTVQVTYYIN